MRKASTARKRYQIQELGTLEEDDISPHFKRRSSFFENELRIFDAERYINAQQLTLIENISRNALSRKLLVLDLDETLIHTSTRSTLFTPRPPEKLYPDFRLEVPFPSHPIPVLYYVYKRPHVIHFLKTVSQWYDIAVYTASVRQYANEVIDILEREADINISQDLRFFREHCIPTQPSQQLPRTTTTTSTGQSSSLMMRSSTYRSIPQQLGNEMSPSTPFLGLPVTPTPVAPSANLFTKNLDIVVKRWLILRKLKRSWRRPSQQQRRRRSSSRTGSQSEVLLSQSEAFSTDVDEDEVEQAMSKVILLDNSITSFIMQPFNGFHLPQWINDPRDELLVDVLPVLDALRFVIDVRSVLGLRAFEQFISINN